MLKIDDKEYQETDLTNEQQYMLNQVLQLTDKSKLAKFEIDQIDVAKTAFSNALVASVRESESVTVTEGGVDAPVDTCQLNG